MKTKSFLLVAVATIFLSVACSDKDDIGGNTLPSHKAGDAIQFSVVNSEASTRTHYDSQDSKGNWQMVWDSGDVISVYSAEVNTANGGVNQADYIVTPVNDTLYHGTIKAEDSTKVMKWGESPNETDFTKKDGYSNTYLFHAAYPSEHVVSYSSSSTRGYVEMDYLTNQVCTVESYDETGGARTYYAKPDMTCAYMIARDTVNQKNDHVLLHFNPIMTTLDITVTAGGYESGTGIIQPLTITGVSIISPYSLENNTFVYNASDGSNGSNKIGYGDKGSLIKTEEYTSSVFVGLVDGNENHYVSLNTGESVNLMAFIPPFDASQMAYSKDTTIIRVHTIEGYTFEKKIPNKESSKYLENQYRVDIKLPKINLDNAVVNDSTWITRLGNNVKVSEMSIPGDVTRYWLQDDNDDKKQPLTEKQIINRTDSLLKRGIRAFDVRKTEGNGYRYMGTAIATFLKYNPGEFVIIYEDRLETHGMLKDFMLNCFDYVYTGTEGKIDENLTIGDLRKHVIFVRQYKDQADDNSHQNTRILYLQTGLFGAKSVERSDDMSTYIKNSVAYITDGSGLDFDFDSDSSIKRIRFSSIDNKDNDGVSGSSTCPSTTELKTRYKSIYNQIVERTDQTGDVGIVMFPYSFWNSTVFEGYDELIQSIIDCNFKFRLGRK